MNDTDLLEDRSAASGGETSGPAPTTESSAPARRRATRGAGDAAAGGGLAGKLLPELQEMATSLGIAGIGKLRKGQLIAAIQESRSGGAPAAAATTAPAAPAADPTPAADPVVAPTAAPTAAVSNTSSDSSSFTSNGSSGNAGESGEPRRDGRRRSTYEERQRAREERAAQNGDAPAAQSSQSGRTGNNNGSSRGEQGNRNPQNSQNNQGNTQVQSRDDEDEDEFGNRSRRGRYRDRRRGRERQPGGQGQGQDAEPVIREDDVLAPVAGILDTSDSYAFLRTSGYLAGPKDVYVSMNLVRRHGLRRGDAITGVVRANEGEQQQGNRREKYVPLVRLDTVNGVTPEESKNRPEFAKLTPLYPQERLRLETESSDLVTRVIDLVMPIGKGQRALIVSPPKAGKTTVLQRIANAITINNPEVHLMVVLVDERPEEVTDMQRSVKGEVIASTFDRPASDHTTLSELAIERAKRLVELGHDVVVMLDNLTRLGRAYNLAAPASGRILSGGVDSAALYPPKRFLGAARNIENGGSLTILATALVDTGSTMDTVIFEEFKGTGNAELMLSRKIADKRTFPAVDIDGSSTRKDELLMSPEEYAVVQKLRRVLHALDSQSSIELLLQKLKETPTNIQFLQQIAKTTPGE